MLIAAGLVAILLLLSALHFYWGVGGRWPGHDAASLSLRVVGTPSAKVPSFLACAAVAAALACASLIVAFGQTPIAFGLQALVVYGGYVVLIAVFALRGLAPYVTPAFNYAKGTPFFTLNRRYYAPLCLLIAAALIATFPRGAEAALHDAVQMFRLSAPARADSPS